MVLSDKTHEPQGRHHVRQKLPDDGTAPPLSARHLASVKLVSFTMISSFT